jgi:hypothetical protein
MKGGTMLNNINSVPVEVKEFLGTWNGTAMARPLMLSAPETRGQ